MTKKISTILIFSTVLLGTLSPLVAFGQSTRAECEAVGRVWVENDMGGECGASQQSQGGKDYANAQKEKEVFADVIFGGLIKGVGYALMSISGLILTIVGGTIFDPVMQFTVIDMAKNIGDANGVGGSITGAWTTLRDIANMCFIFVLLFAAFKSMFELNFGSVGITIRNIIIAALLINFSLFFTKVVIDASNIVSTGFYKSITTANVVVPPVGPVQPQQMTISKGYMNLLDLDSWHDTKIFEIPNLNDPVKILGIGVLSSIFFLVAAVVLLVTAVMFLARFIILIFLMILSPLAFIAYVAPGGGAKAKEWWNALKDQVVFAPVFFALTWVAFKMANGLKASFAASGNLANASFIEIMGGNPTSYASVVLNFVLIIGFMVAALVISKKIASSTPYFSETSGAIAGSSAWALRNSVGAIGNAISKRAGLLKAAKEKTGFSGAGARLALYAGQKARDATFDIRNASVPTGVIGDAIEGTLGRTGIGKAVGLNDVNIPNIEVGKKYVGDALGKAGTKGYKETREESAKRVREREAKFTSEVNAAQAKKAVEEGSKSGVAPGTPAYDAMQQALSKLSDKETETLVSNNRELLDSLNFANAISVKQLDAIIKSDQFSDDDKKRLKDNRFRDIDTAMASGVAIPPGVADKIKALADSEIEMLDAKYLESEDFVSKLKGSQVDAINKSNKFTSAQKKKLGEVRMAPMKNAILTARRTGNPGPAQAEFRKADIKTKIAYLKTEVTPGGTKIGLDPTVLNTYTIKHLTKMAAHDDMSDTEIRALRAELLRIHPVGSQMQKWLTDPDKGMIEFFA